MSWKPNQLLISSMSWKQHLLYVSYGKHINHADCVPGHVNNLDVN